MLNLRHVSTPNGLNDISLEVEIGEVVAVIGPNGSGKSLLGRVIADPDIRFTGEITVNHYHSRTEPDKVKLQIGYASPMVATEPYLTGFEYLDLLGSFCHLSATERRQRILTLAREFGCLDELYTLGEKQNPAVLQKIRLIASLLAEPPLVVWDEPTQFLDEFGRLSVTAALEKAVKAGRTFLILTNDLVFAEKVADRLVVLSHHQVVTEGTVKQLEHLAGHHNKDLAAIFTHLLAHD